MVCSQPGNRNYNRATKRLILENPHMRVLKVCINCLEDFRQQGSGKFREEDLK